MGLIFSSGKADTGLQWFSPVPSEGRCVMKRPLFDVAMCSTFIAAVVPAPLRRTSRSAVAVLGWLSGEGRRSPAPRGRRGRVSASVVGAALVLAAVPATAGAFTVGPFTLRPQGPGSLTANTQAGTNADLATNTVAFGGYASSTDTLKDLSLQLAPGVLANPSTIPAADQCTTATLAAAMPTCPPGGLVGTGTLTANVGALGAQRLSANAYLTAPPTPADAAGVGIIFSVASLPVVGVAGSADVEPNGTLQFNFANLPQTATVLGVSQPIQITGLQLTINGTVSPDGTTQVPFTRLPTSCGTATSMLRADAYSAPSVVQTQAAQFTPTGCDQLTYAPVFFQATATLDSGDPGVGLSTTFNLGAGAMQSASSAVSLTLPFGALAPNAGTLIDEACASPLTSACEPIGTAAVTTPLLGDVPFDGKLYAVRSGGLPGLSIVFPPPVGLELDGVTTVGAGGAIVETFANIPDLPLSSLRVTIPSTGGNSLFGVGPMLCARSAPAVSAVFTPANGGRSVASSVGLTRVNCPGTGFRLPSVTLPRSQVVRLARNHTGRVLATCSRGTCIGTLTLTVSVTQPTGHGRHARVRIVRRLPVATGRFLLRAGSRRPAIRVRLTAAGRKLVIQHHLRLKTAATMRYAGLRSLGSVTLTAARR